MAQVDISLIGECKMVAEKSAPGKPGKMRAPGRKAGHTRPKPSEIEIVIKSEHAFILQEKAERGVVQEEAV